QSKRLLNLRGKIKLSDLGKSRHPDPTLVAETFVGTAHYMAPESISGGKQYLVKSDV
ncbi:MAP kinase kinase (MEK), partial [Rhizina undulata]